MFPAHFGYFAARSVEEALALLTKYGDDAKLLAGGHSLIPAMKLRLATPKYLIDLGTVPGLRGVRVDGDSLAIGALTVHADVAASDLVRQRVPSLAEAAALIGDVQVRNRGTIGGSVAHNDPAADFPVILLALDAAFVLVSPSGRRTVAAADFFVDFFTTALAANGVLTEIRVPLPASGAGTAYAKLGHPASGYVVVSAGVLIQRQASGQCASACIAIGGLGGGPRRATATEAALPAVVNAEKALEPGAPLAREELDSNICYIATKRGGDVDRAFAAADHIVRMHIASPRLVALAIEPRGVLAKPEPAGDLTVWLSTQSPHRVRADLVAAIGFPEHRIRVIAPDVGGGFGSKGTLYQEEALACHLALQLGWPIKWIATRSEDFLTTNQGRDQAMTAELALTRDGTILGLKVRVVANMGAYLQSITAIPPLFMMAMAPGCYQIRHCQVEVVAVFTNTVSTGPYRGAGRPEAVLNIERLIDKAARDLGIDRLDIRRKNFIRPEQFPYRTGLNVEYDSGDYEKALAEALRLSGYDQMIQYRDAARARGELVGVGVSTFVEPSGGVGFESGTVRVERTGEITVLTGSSPHGQGHETVFAQVVADKLRIAMDHVAIRHGDTLAIQQGVGTFGSRSAVMGGGALALATQRVSAKAQQIAAHLLEAAAEDIVPAEGGFAVAGVPTEK